MELSSQKRHTWRWHERRIALHTFVCIRCWWGCYVSYYKKLNTKINLAIIGNNKIENNLKNLTTLQEQFIADEVIWNDAEFRSVLLLIESFGQDSGKKEFLYCFYKNLAKVTLLSCIRYFFCITNNLLIFWSQHDGQKTIDTAGEGPIDCWPVSNKLLCINWLLVIAILKMCGWTTRMCAIEDNGSRNVYVSL